MDVEIFIPPGMYLLPDTEAEYSEWLAHTNGCSCHLHPPCWSCTHHGNPMNINNSEHRYVFGVEDVSLWAEYLARQAQRLLHRQIDLLFAEALGGE